MTTPEAWLKGQLPLAPLLQKRGSPGEVPQAWELLSSLGERERRIVLGLLSISCHGTGLGLRSRTGRPDSDLCFPGRQPVFVSSGFHALRRVTEQAPATILGRPNPGPSPAGRPDSGVWVRTWQQEGTTALSPFPWPLLRELSSTAWRGRGARLEAPSSSPRQHRIQIWLFHHEQVLPPLLDRAVSGHGKGI